METTIGIFSGLYKFYIRMMEKKMGLYRGYIRILEKKAETIGII